MSSFEENTAKKSKEIYDAHVTHHTVYSDNKKKEADSYSMPLSEEEAKELGGVTIDGEGELQYIEYVNGRKILMLGVAVAKAPNGESYISSYAPLDETSYTKEQVSLAKDITNSWMWLTRDDFDLHRDMSSGKTDRTAQAVSELGDISESSDKENSLNKEIV